MRNIKTLLLFTLGLWSATAFSHSVLHDSIPQNGATLSTAPESATLNFADSVRLLKLTLVDAHKKKTSINLDAISDAQKSYRIPLPKIATGQYQLLWVAIAKDTHKLKGRIRFSIQATNSSAPQQPNQQNSPPTHQH